MSFGLAGVNDGAWRHHSWKLAGGGGVCVCKGVGGGS